jgi:hypothetical protein
MRLEGYSGDESGSLDDIAGSSVSSNDELPVEPNPNFPAACVGALSPHALYDLLISTGHVQASLFSVICPAVAETSFIEPHDLFERVAVYVAPSPLDFAAAQSLVPLFATGTAVLAMTPTRRPSAFAVPNFAILVPPTLTIFRAPVIFASLLSFAWVHVWFSASPPRNPPPPQLRLGLVLLLALSFAATSRRSPALLAVFGEGLSSEELQALEAPLQHVTNCAFLAGAPSNILRAPSNWTSAPAALYASRQLIPAGVASAAHLVQQGRLPFLATLSSANKYGAFLRLLLLGLRRCIATILRPAAFCARLAAAYTAVHQPSKRTRRGQCRSVGQRSLRERASPPAALRHSAAESHVVRAVRRVARRTRISGRRPSLDSASATSPCISPTAKSRDGDAALRMPEVSLLAAFQPTSKPLKDSV